MSITNISVYIHIWFPASLKLAGACQVIRTWIGGLEAVYRSIANKNYKRSINCLADANDS